jgi:hypothetical protein
LFFNAHGKKLTRAESERNDKEQRARYYKQEAEEKLIKRAVEHKRIKHTTPAFRLSGGRSSGEIV